MKEYFVAVALFCSLIWLSGCGKDNQVTNNSGPDHTPTYTYTFNGKVIDRDQLAGYVELHYFQNNFYVGKAEDIKLRKNIITFVIAQFFSIDKQSFLLDNNPLINTFQLKSRDDNSYKTDIHRSTDANPLILNFGNDRPNIFEKGASELYPAFSHEVFFGEPVRIVNFTPNQVLDPSKSVTLELNSSKNQLINHKVLVRSYKKVPGSPEPDELELDYVWFNQLKNTNKIVIPSQVLERCNADHHDIVVVREEAMLVPVDVNRAKLNKHKQYYMLYVGSSTFRTSFLLK